MLLPHLPIKPLLTRLAMTTIGLSLIALSFVKVVWLAFVLLAVVGGAGVVQFNTTNTLFQMLSPPELRGRVIAMHVWALSGLSPFGALLFGYLATVIGLPSTLLIGGCLVSLGAAGAWVFRRGLAGVH